ncbi:hypothetical protein DRN74_00100 [Candidatus Micrarchaeota archaeon]|nr:MAG: hypothetical protein DRN74_00100 [Candidatus Micrarchaeota archaeon]
MVFVITPLELWLIAVMVGSLGSISFGYLTLRYAYPDIRSLNNKDKWFYSLMTGFLIFALSFLASYFISYYLFFITYPMLVLVIAVFIYLKSSMGDTIKVALPVLRFDVGAFKKKETSKQFTEKKAAEEKHIGPSLKLKTPELKLGLAKIMNTGQETHAQLFDKLNEAVESYKKRAAERRARRGKHREKLIEQVKIDMTYKKGSGEKTVPTAEKTAEAQAIDLSSIESLTLEDLSLDNSAELGTLSELESELSNIAGVNETEEIPKEKGMTCPNCGRKNVTVIYCPYCGKGFCSHCASSVRREGDMIIYKCPHCGKDVIVKQ